MAVVTVKEIHNGRDAEDITNRDSAETRYTRIFRVVTDDAYDDSTIILGHEDVPKNGDRHDQDELARCRRRVARNESFSKIVWIVTCAYSTALELQSNPLNDAARITWATQQYQAPFIKDRDGKAVTNSAGDPFDPPAEKEDSRWAVTVQKNVTSIPASILAYRNAINSTEFVVDGIPVASQHGLISSINIGEFQYRNAIAYRSFSFTMQLRDSTEGAWVISIADLGLNQIFAIGDETVLERIKIADGDDKNEWHTTPQQLDGSGFAVDNPTSLTVVFRNFNAYNLLDFNVLPLS